MTSQQVVFIYSGGCNKHLSGFPTSGFDRRNQGRQKVVATSARGLREGEPLDVRAKLCQRRDDRLRLAHDAQQGGFEI